MSNSIIKNTLIALLCGVSCTLFSQNVAINPSGNSPYTSAILDLSNHNTVGTFGFLPPYVTLTSLTSFNPAVSGTAAQSNGIIVYCSGLSTVPAGLYYWNNTGNTWVAMVGSSLSGGLNNYIARWTSATTLGTGVAQDNGTDVWISSTALTPANKLDVNGSEAVGTYAGTAAPTNGMIVSGTVGIGTSAPAASSIIDFTNTKATGLTGAPLVWPTSPNPSADITPPVLGEEIYNTTTGCFNFYNGSAWIVVGCPCTIAPGTPTITATGCSTAFGGGTVTYTSSITTGATFVWTATATTGTPTITGNGTATITVTWPAGSGTGTVSLNLANVCGTSTGTLAVTINGISGPVPIGLSSVGNVFTCTLSGATSYAWSSSSTYATITSSTIAQSITVSAASTQGLFTLTCVVTIGGCTYTTTLADSVSTCNHGTASYAWNGVNTIIWMSVSTPTYYDGTVQRWAIPPCISSITVVATGGSGGPWDDGNGGMGAIITSNSIAVTPGHVLHIIAGGQGTAISSAYGGGGGGGSFVWDSNTGVLLVAAGGGGGGGYEADGNGANAQTTNTSAAALETATNNTYGLNGAGGTGGGALSGGARGDSISYGGQGCGGAGWGENGGIVPAGFLYPYIGNGYYPFDPTYPAQGGLPWTDYSIVSGGFGGYGGGAGGGWNGGGGGGGYNGGGGGSDDFTTYSYGGGGGGSYCNGTTAASTALGSLNTNGSVIINY